MNQIKQGYKQTKVGIIPKDWDVVKLNEKSSIQRGRFSPRPRNDPQFYNGDYPFVQTNDVVNSKGKITNYSQTLNEKGLKVSKLFPQGTILMTIAANIGFTGILTRDMTCPDSLVGIQCKKGLFNEYIKIYFIFNQKRIDYLAEEAAQKNINLSTLNSFHIPLPPLKEQEKIAEILTTWDEAITKQTELLEAKELLKIALMQKLLSGEVRFGGFTDEWETIKFGKVGEFYLGLTYTPKYVSNGVPFLSVKDLSRGKISFDDTKFISHEEFEKSTNNAKPRKNDILFGRVGTLGNPIIIDFEREFCIFVSLGFLRVNEDINNVFIKYWMNSDIFEKQIESQVSGSSQKNLNVGWLKNFKIKLPSLLEQHKIAEVLSLVDDEINLLKNELEELKLQKKALMQKLLTGEVRVKV